MLKTGNIFLDFLSIASIFIKLLPIAIILFKKEYQQETLNFLMILCLLNFFRTLLPNLIDFTSTEQNIISNIFSFTELILLVFIFRQSLPFKANPSLTIFFIALISFLTSVYLFYGLGQKAALREWLLQLGIVLLSVLCIIQLVETDYLYILSKPLFWIAVGSLFYFLIAMLVQIINWSYMQAPETNGLEKKALLDIASIIRYLFYVLAASYLKPKRLN